MRHNVTLVLLFLTSVAAAAACDFQRRSTSSATSLAPTAGASSSLVGTWSSVGTPGPASSSACTNVTWTVATQTDTDIAGNFSAVCLGNAQITGTGTGHIAGSTMAINLTGNGTMPGLDSCPFTIGGTGTITGDVIVVPYTGTTCLGPVSGTQTLRRDFVQPSQAFNAQTAIFLNNPADVAFWPQTARMTSVQFGGGQITFDFDRRVGPNRWPESAFGDDAGLQYTLGMCLYRSGQWYCSAAIQFWDGRDPVATADIANNWYYDPARWGLMAQHQPANGEMVAIFVGQGNLRGGGNTNRERSDFVVMPFGGTYHAQ